MLHSSPTGTDAACKGAAKEHSAGDKVARATVQLQVLSFVYSSTNVVFSTNKSCISNSSLSPKRRSTTTSKTLAAFPLPLELRKT